MKALYLKPIKSVADLVELFDDLKSDAKTYHPEDSAADIIRLDEGIFRPIFSPCEAEALDDRMDEAYSIDWDAEDVFECPCDLLLTIEPAREIEEMEEEERIDHNAKLKALAQLRKEPTK